MLYSQMSQQELEALGTSYLSKYKKICAEGHHLDLSRGKPGRAQLNMMQGMLYCIHSSADCRSADGFDYRNYGLLDGALLATECSHPHWQKAEPMTPLQ